MCFRRMGRAAFWKRAFVAMFKYLVLYRKAFKCLQALEMAIDHKCSQVIKIFLT